MKKSNILGNRGDTLVPINNPKIDPNYSTQRQIKANEEIKKLSTANSTKKRGSSEQDKKQTVQNSNSSGVFMGSGGKRIKGSNVKKNRL